MSRSTLFVAALLSLAIQQAPAYAEPAGLPPTTPLAELPDTAGDIGFAPAPAQAAPPAPPVQAPAASDSSLGVYAGRVYEPVWPGPGYAFVAYGLKHGTDEVTCAWQNVGGHIVDETALCDRAAIAAGRRPPRTVDVTQSQALSEERPTQVRASDHPVARTFAAVGLLTGLAVLDAVAERGGYYRYYRWSPASRPPVRTAGPGGYYPGCGYYCRGR